jgi:RNA polymerase sigma-70 factor (ECF subfamily)
MALAVAAPGRSVRIAPGAAEAAEGRLVARAREGDGEAFARLVELHRHVAFRAAYFVTGSAAEAEDAAQEGFVKAWRALGRFRPGSPFRPWLLRIVANEARNRRRSAGRRTALALRAAELAPGPAGSPEADLLAGEQRTQLLAAVRALSEADRLVIACRYYLELGEEETAGVLDCRRGTVKSRTSRALARLREQLGEEAA